jgi:hypothetical protein
MALLKNVTVLFSHVTNVDDFSGKYQMVVSMSEEQAADAETAGIKVKTKEYEGKPQFQATFKTKFKVNVVDQAKVEIDLGSGEVGYGSLVNVQYKDRHWTGPQGNTGVANDLVAVQVLALKGGSGGDEFDVEEVAGAEEDSEF